MRFIRGSYFYYLRIPSFMIKLMIKTTNAKATGPQIGQRTHHHDHVITFVSLRTMKTIARIPVNPIPVVEFSIFICFTITTY